MQQWVTNIGATYFAADLNQRRSPNLTLDCIFPLHFLLLRDVGHTVPFFAPILEKRESRLWAVPPDAYRYRSLNGVAAAWPGAPAKLGYPPNLYTRFRGSCSSSERSPSTPLSVFLRPTRPSRIFAHACTRLPRASSWLLAPSSASSVCSSSSRLSLRNTRPLSWQR